MKKLYYGIDVCDWCFEEAQAPHIETLDALWKFCHPASDYRSYYHWIYLPVFAYPQQHAAMKARQELNDALLEKARGPSVTIELEFSGEEGSLTLCSRHVGELLAGIQGAKE